jgi:hypothetical protein
MKIFTFKFNFAFAVLILLLLLDDNSFSQVSSDVVLENVSVTAIRDEPNYVWLATYGQGVYRYSKKENKWTNFSTSNNNLESDLFSCYASDELFGLVQLKVCLLMINRNTWRKKICNGR